MTRDDTRTRQRRDVAAVLLVLLGVFALAMASSPAIAANNSTNNTTSPYYANASSNVSWDGWMAGHAEPTLANVTHYLSRVGPVFIGSDVRAQGGVGAAGVMIFGLVIFGAIAGGAISSGTGSVGGATLGIVTAAGLSSAGLAPTWMFALGLFLLGLVGAKVYIDIFR